MTGRPFFCVLGDGDRKHPWRARLSQGQVTHALTTAASGMRAKMMAMTCFMIVTA